MMVCHQERADLHRGMSFVVLFRRVAHQDMYLHVSVEETRLPVGVQNSGSGSALHAVRACCVS